MVDASPLIPDSSSTSTKQGHRVFGCLDSRKAVILINAIALVLYQVLIINDAMKSTFETPNVILVIVTMFLFFLFYILVMSSALKFEHVPVIFAIVWAVISIILTTVSLVNIKIIGNFSDPIVGYVFSYVLHVLMIYVDWVYVSEVHKGIMSRETYSREEYSLCHRKATQTIIVDSSPLIPESSDTKQGRRVFCCCDSRKAAIAINAIAIVLSVCYSILLAADHWDIVIICYTILFYTLAVWSALQFKDNTVMVAILWAVISIILLTINLVKQAEAIASKSDMRNMIIVNVILYVLHVLMIYADWVYVSEVGKGIMSRENHSREKYSCCCNV